MACALDSTDPVAGRGINAASGVLGERRRMRRETQIHEDAWDVIDFDIPHAHTEVIEDGYEGWESRGITRGTCSRPFSTSRLLTVHPSPFGRSSPWGDGHEKRLALPTSLAPPLAPKPSRADLQQIFTHTKASCLCLFFFFFFSFLLNLVCFFGVYSPSFLLSCFLS